MLLSPPQEDVNCQVFEAGQRDAQSTVTSFNAFDDDLDCSSKHAPIFGSSPRQSKDNSSRRPPANELLIPNIIRHGGQMTEEPHGFETRT